MIKKLTVLLVVLMVFILTISVSAQSFSFEVDETSISITPAETTLVFHSMVKNLLDSEVTVQGHRTVIHSPENWTSTMCFGVCLPDTANTTFAIPIPAGDSLEFELDVNITDTSEDYTEIQIRMQNTRVSEDFVDVLFTVSTLPTGIDVEQNNVQNDFALEQNYPNPFNPETSIKYHLPVMSNVELSVYNSVGQKIKSLVNSQENAGDHLIKWNGTDNLNNVRYKL